MQGRAPEYMYVVVPWSDFEPQHYRYADYAAYFRKVKRGMLASLAAQDAAGRLSRSDRALRNLPLAGERATSAAATTTIRASWPGFRKLQINELKAARRHDGGSARRNAAALALETRTRVGGVLYPCPRAGADSGQARKAGERKFEVLPVENGFGLTRLPEPSDGDVFLDLEGDPFAGEGGFEYLFGYLFTGEDGKPAYTGRMGLLARR